MGFEQVVLWNTKLENIQKPICQFLSAINIHSLASLFTGEGSGGGANGSKAHTATHL
jgi:hypothetical protein